MAGWLAEAEPVAEKEAAAVDRTLKVGIGAQLDRTVVLALAFGEWRFEAAADAVPRVKLGAPAAAG